MYSTSNYVTYNFHLSFSQYTDTYSYMKSITCTLGSKNKNILIQLLCLDLSFVHCISTYFMKICHKSLHFNYAQKNSLAKIFSTLNTCWNTADIFFSESVGSSNYIFFIYFSYTICKSVPATKISHSPTYIYNIDDKIQ